MVRAALEEARDQVAALFGVRPRQVVLTSGGTEAVNAAVGARCRAPTPGPVACAAVEHSAVRDASARDGPGGDRRRGRPRPDRRPAPWRARSSGAAAEHGRPPALVHCQWANHEVGHRAGRGRGRGASAGPRRPRPRRRRGRRRARAPSTSARSAPTWCRCRPTSSGGPAGIGALSSGAGLRIEPLLVGGEQERARRAGLENVVGAIGFGAAADALADPGAGWTTRPTARRPTDRLRHAAAGGRGRDLFGDPVDRLPHILCLGVAGVEAEPVLLGLDQAGIAVHSGSSCSSESLEPSPVLEAMGVDGERSLRLSVGWSTTDADVEAFAAAFAGVVGSSCGPPQLTAARRPARAARPPVGSAAMRAVVCQRVRSPRHPGRRGAARPSPGEGRWWSTWRPPGSTSSTG